MNYTSFIRLASATKASNQVHNQYFLGKAKAAPSSISEKVTRSDSYASLIKIINL